MPFYYILDADRVEFKDPITITDIDYLVSYPQIKVLQCSSPVKDATWDLLNSEFFQRRPDVEFRIFGFYSQKCDLSFASRMSYVRHFTANCLMNATGVEAIAEIPGLQTLIIGIDYLDNFNFLWNVSDTLTSLLLGATRSKKPDLTPLSRFQGLTRIYLDGQQKNIEVLAELGGLEEVTLRSITTSDLSFLSGLNKMWSLDVKLGGIHNLTAIGGMRNIKYLELWQVRGLNDIKIITRLPGLQNLFLQSLPQIDAIPSLREASNLRRMTIQNLKGLKDFSELQWAPALEEFILIQGQPQQPEDLLPVLLNPTIRRVSTHFGSIKKEERMMKLLNAHSIERTAPSPFQYL